MLLTQAIFDFCDIINDGVAIVEIPFQYNFDISDTILMLL